MFFNGTSLWPSHFCVMDSTFHALQGAKVTQSPESNYSNVSQSGRTLEEARKLVEQSFGNYVGSNVMLAAKEELAKIQNEIEILTSEISDEAIDKKSQKLLTESAYREISDLQEELRVSLITHVLPTFIFPDWTVYLLLLFFWRHLFLIQYNLLDFIFPSQSEKRLRTELRRRVELERMFSLRPLLKKLGEAHLPFMCLQYSDSGGVQHQIPAVYLGMVDSLKTSKVKNLVSLIFYSPSHSSLSQLSFSLALKNTH